MKNLTLFSFFIAAAIFSMAACGESEAEREARLQAYQDSLRQAEQAKVAAMIAELQQDSIAAAQAEVEKMEEESPANNYSFVENGAFMVQVGAWRSEEKAQRFVDNWSERGYPNAFVVSHGNELTGDVWFRVRVGNFGTRTAAAAFGAELAAEINSDFWVVNAK